MKRFLVAGLVGLLGAGVASGNLLLNGGFETGDLTDWDGPGWYVGTDADANSGTYGAAYAVPTDTAADNWYVAVQYVDVSEGSKYDASIWARTVNLSASESFLEVVFHDDTGGWLYQTGSVHVTTSQDYGELSINEMQAPAGAVTASVRAVVHTTGTTTDNAWHTFDDASFTQTIPEPTTLAFFGLAVGFLTILRRRSSR